MDALNIEKLVYGGHGLGHHDGKAVFVPFTVPGDLVHWEPVKDRRRFCMARAVRIVSRSQFRTGPLCANFGLCGGCQWQHVDYSAQIFWKEDIFTSILRRQCSMDVYLVRPIVPSPLQWHYRCRSRLRVRRHQGQVQLGYFQAGTHKIVPVDRCLLLDSRLNTLLERVRGHLIDGRYVSGRGIKGLVLEAGDSGGVRVVLDTGFRTVRSDHRRWRRFESQYRQRAETFVSSCPFPVSVWIRSIDGVLRCLSDRYDDLFIHAPIIHPVSGERIQLAMPPMGFSQVNLEQNRTLVALVMEAVQETAPPPLCVLDLYCGMGNFTLAMSTVTPEVHGVDVSSVSVHAARRNARACGIDNVSFISEDVGAFLAHSRDVDRYDLVLLDPPRIGAAAAVKLLLAHVRPHTIVYVSCDPMTLARDLKVLLSAGYAVRWSRAVDLFPQTYHIESVTVLDFMA